MSRRCHVLLTAIGAVLVLGITAAFPQSPPGTDLSNQESSVAQPAPASSEPLTPPPRGAAEQPQSSPSPAQVRAQLPADNIATPSLGVSQKRDPFWPVGYVPRPAPVAPVEKKSAPAQAVVLPPVGQDWARALEQVRVQGVVGGRHGKFFATVNGRVVEAGDEVSVSFEGSVYRWRVRSIDAKGIATEPLGVRAER